MKKSFNKLFIAFCMIGLGFSSCFSSLLFATPATVAILRHGEKQMALDAQGQPLYHKNKIRYTKYLSVKGWERAYALAPFFTMNTEYSKFGKPSAIFASLSRDPSASVRARDTITPTAIKMGLEVQTQYSSAQYQELADHILTSPEFDGKYVIICFAHSHIPLLAEALQATSAPKKWASDVFDRVWILHFSQDDTKESMLVKFEDKPQQLLFGDTKI